MSNLKVNTINDASGGSSAVLYGVASPPNSMGFRNRIINGDMRIDQRNAGASVTPINGQYVLDRWTCSISQAAKYSVQQNAGAVTPPAGFTKYLGVTSLSAYAVTANDRFGVEQVIEGFNVADLDWGTASASPATLSFWVRSSLTGTFGGTIATTKTAIWVMPFSYTIAVANTWTYITVAVTAPTATGGANTDNSQGVYVRFGLGSAGTSAGGTAGVWTSAGNFEQPAGTVSVVGTSGATFYITGVQLEAGSVATPFERRDYGRELMMCQRYLPCYDASNGFATAAPVGSAFAQSATLVRAVYAHKTPTRVPPTGIIVTSPTNFTFASTTGFVASAVTFSFAGVDASLIDLTVTAITAGQGGYVYGGASTCKILFTGCEL